MKKIILTILLLIICGCSANYNLVIDGNYISEDVLITIPKSVISKEDLEKQAPAKKSVYRDYISYYDRKTSDDASNYYLSYSFNHAINKYIDSSILRACYSSRNVSVTDNTIEIETSGNFNCIYRDDGVKIDEVLVNIKTELKVVSNNADKVDGNTYTWVFNKQNYKKKGISIKLDKSKKTVKKKSNLLLSIVIIVLSIGALSAGGFLFLRDKNIKNNNI